MRKTTLGTILVHLSLLWASTSFSQEVFVRIDAAEKQRAYLRHLPLALHYRSDDYLLATMDKHQLPELSQSGVSFKVLDEAPWIEPSTAIGRLRAKPQNDLAQIGGLRKQKANSNPPIDWRRA